MILRTTSRVYTYIYIYLFLLQQPPASCGGGEPLMRTAGYQALIPAPNGARNPRPRQRQNPGPGPKGRKRSCVKAEDRRECARSCHGAQIRSGASSGRFQAAMCGTIASSHFPISFCNSRCVSCLFSCLRIGVLVFFLVAAFWFLSLSLFLQSPFLNSRSVCM